MKQNYLFIITLLLNYCIGYGQNFGQLASGIKINNTIYNTTGDASHKINPSLGAQDFDGANLGIFGANSICANITGGEIKTNKAALANVCSATIFWSVYPSGSPSGSFTPISLATVSDCDTGTNIFYDGIGVCGNGDQKWKDYNLNVNFATGLAPGNYTLEIYYTYTGSYTSTSTCETTEYISNGGPNYKASFTITSPTITCPSNITQNVDSSLCTANITTINPTIADNCFITKLTWELTGATSGTSPSTGINNLDTQVFNTGLTTVTYRAEDAAGNFTTCSYTVTVVNNQAPAISCPANISVNNTPGTCGTAVTYSTPVGTDNCSGAITVQTAGLASGADFPVGTTTNTFKVTDAAGLETFCSFTVTVVDIQAPAITCPVNISVNNTPGTCGAAVTYSTPVGTDNCSGATTVQTAGLASGANFPLGTTTNTFKVTDTAGLETFCSFTVTVVDNQAPTITCPANISVNITPGTCGAAVTYSTPVGIDNCSGATTVQTAGLASGANFPVGTTTNTFKVTDASNLETFCSFTVTVVDNQAPTITCPTNISVNNTPETCGAAVTYSTPVGTDNCSGAITVQTAGLASGANFPVGTTTNTFKVTDAADLETFCSFTVTVVDNQAPAITCPANITTAKTSNDGTGNCTTTVALGNPIVSDNCTAVGLLTITNNAPVNFPIGLTTVTWTVKDAANNSTTCTQNVTVTDDEAPTITCPANITTAKTSNDGTGNCTTTVALGNPTVSDNCTAVGLLTITNNAPVNFPIGLTTVTWTVKDAANNSTTCTQNVTVTDDEAPTITCPANITTAKTSNDGTGNCTTTIALGNPIVSDNCTATSSLTITNNVPVNFPIGLTTVTWTVKDAANNTTTCIQNVTVTDDEAPAITCPANISVNNTPGNCGAAVTYSTPVGTDNCSGATTVQTAGLASGANFPVGTTTNTFKVTDAADLETFCSFTVTVVDNQAPTITCPANITTAKTSNDGTGNCTTTVTLGNPIVSDNCTAVGLLTITNNAPVNFPIGLTTVTWTVKDAANNTTTCTQNVTVTDDEAPTITCPANITTAKTSNDGTGNCTTTVALGNPIVSDNCTATSSLTVTNNAPVNFPIGLTIVTWTVKDAANNTTTCTQNVTVTDDEAPSITCPASITTAKTSNDGTGNCTTTVALGNPIVSDNCTATSSLTITNNAPVNFPIGLTTVTWTVKDAANNSTTCTQNVTVTDDEAPSITCPASITTAKTSNDGTGNCTTTVALGNPIVSDNCTATSSLTVTNNAPVNFPIGLTTVTWTVKDAANNTTTCTQNITVTDDEAPTINAPSNVTANTNIGCTATGVATGAPITTDNCSVAKLIWTMTGATVASSPNTGINNIGPYTFNLGTTTIAYTVFDIAGNSATASFTIIVKDTTNPTLTQGSNQSATTAAGTCNASVAIINAGFEDNCSGSTIAYTLSGATVKSLTAGQVGTYTFNKGITTITYTVTDGATPANTFTGTKTVTVTDNVKPVAPTMSTITAQCAITVPLPVASDNCDGTVTATTSDNRTFNSQGNYAIIWSFKDSSNNETIVTQNVVIDDTIAPVPSIASLSPLTIINCQIDSLTPPTANDNCKGIIAGTTTTPFPITTIGTTVITWTYNDGNGNISTQNQSVTLTKPAISGGSLLGYDSSLIPATTPSENIAITSCPDEINPITINLSGEIGTIVHWEKFEAGNTAWSIIKDGSNNPITTNSYNIIFNYSNTKSTLFRVLVQVGNCTKYSNMVNVHAIPPDVPPILDQSLFNICLNGSVSLVARSGYTSTVNVGEGGDFDTGQFPDHWDPTQWRIDDQVAGAQWTAAGNNTKFNNWSGTNDHPVGTLYKILYDSNDLKFGIAHGNYNSAAYIAEFGVGPTTLETPLFSLVGLKTATIDFDQAYNLHAGDICKLELLIYAADGTTLQNTIVLQNLIGTSPHALSWGDTHGAAVTYPYIPPGTNGKPVTNFNFQNDNSSFDISDYIGNDNVRVKWTFFGTTDESAWAIDNITIPVRPYFDDVEWTDGIGEFGEYIIRNKLEATYTFVPSAPGIHLYGATSLINGCRAYDEDGTAIATVKVDYAYAGQAQGYTNAECGERTVSLNAYDNTKSANQNNDDGAYPTLVRNDFSDDPGTMSAGTWSVVTASNSCGTYSFSDVKSPTSTFSGDEGVYTLRWKLDVSGCYSDVQVTLTSCKVIDFDGVNDYITFKDNYGLGSAFSIEVWVKPDPQPASPPSNIQTIVSKRNANSLIDGYDLRLVGSALSFNWNNGSQLISPFLLTTSRWYHVAVTYTGGIYRLYVDGIEVINAAGSAPAANSLACIVGAMDQTGNAPNKPVNHFSGWMDELRIWNVGLSPDHVRQMMNQQITNNGTAVRGEIIPIDINGPDANSDGVDDQTILWDNLLGYYRMDFISCGYLNPYGGKGVDGQLRNITSSQEETAPLPYVSIRDGNWMDRNTGTTPWKYGNTVWDYPNSTGYNGTPIDWNIVQISNNINSGNKDITVLGLISTAGKITIADPTVTTPIEKNDGQSLWITHYLKLNGNIDLVGESQLLEKRYGKYNSSDVFITSQFSESILDPTSTGFIKRDQQGKKNSYNYNYWSSPVSTIQGSLNNMPYTINNVIKDGTNSATPKTINFGSTFDFADTSITDPIKITDRWIWSYNSPIIAGDEWANYYQWYHITSSGTLKVGEAYTMKGTGGTAPLTDVQNYSFIGKPNSGTITLNLTKDSSYLIGNPYPSALDADEFIKDNLKDCSECRASANSFSGALYFWDHFGQTDNHYLAEYEGGYATYTLMGGVAAINNSPLNANNNEIGSNIPQRYIPVAQGFFIDGYLDFEVTGPQIPIVVDGGPILFKDNQRAFQRESVSSSVFMKKRPTAKINAVIKQKIRLGFDSSIGAHRQLLVGTDPNTTTLYDIGYDAPMYDTNENDMYWEINDSQFVIQGVPDFNTDRIIPLGIVAANEGEVTIKIDELENVSSSTKIYLHDNVTGMYHDLKNSDFKITLAIGEYNKRFSLKFESQTLDVVENDSNDGIMVLYSRNYKTLIIKNNDLDTTVNSVSLFNILGQAISNWDVEDKEQTNIQIPIKNISSGIYIVKVKTSNGESSKKIIVN